MLIPAKKDLIMSIDFDTLAPSLNSLYSASTWKLTRNKYTKIMERKKIKGQAKDADDYKKEYRELIINNMPSLIGKTIDERVCLVWTPHTNNRKTGHFDNINFASNYKMIIDVLVSIGLFKNDDYRFISQDVLNCPVLTEDKHFINLSIYKTVPLWV